MNAFLEIKQGDSPIVLGFPHTGTQVPDIVKATLNETGRALTDTDWNIHNLYDGLLDGVTSVRTQIHRYVIDCNRDPKGVSLYPGQNTTTLVPITDFDGNKIYNLEPNEAEIARRRDAYHAPYHAAIKAELERVKAIHGFAILYDCHSIRSEISFLFEGILPTFSIGTNSGESCAAGVEKITTDICANADGHDHVVNGRFKGGWTTRHYGKPANNIHAIQMELTQSSYMNEFAPWDYDKTKADKLRQHLANILQQLSTWRPK